MAIRLRWLGMMVGFMAAMHGATAQGIHFEQGSLEEAQAKATETNKMLFIVVCDDWMDACTILTNEVLIDPAVGRAYNPHFVCWQMDAKLLEEEPFLTDVRIMNIPEYLFFDAAGLPQYRDRKFKSADEMIAMATAARDPQNHLSQWRIRYQQGDRDPAFVSQYLVQMDAAGEDMTAPAAEYLKDVPPSALFKTENWIIAGIGVAAIQAPHFQYVLAHLADFQQQYGEQIVNDFILKVYTFSLRAAVDQQDLQQLGECQAVVRQLLGPEAAKPVILQDELTYHAAGEDWKSYAAKAKELFTDHKLEDASLYNEVAWNLFLHATDLPTLADAATWAARSVALSPAYWNWHTLGSLQWKLGKSKEAMASALEAMKFVDEGTPEEEEVAALIQKIKK